MEAGLRVLVIENYPGTTLGQVGRALDEAGADIDIRQCHAGQPLPDGAGGHDGVVILGGAQNAVDDEANPWLPAVAALSRAFGAADKPVLGICLGAQLVARGLGADNILGRPLELGWRPVRATADGLGDPVLAAIGVEAPIFHWHEDTFTLPEGAVRLASSDMTANQAFRIGRAVYGIQFHFETDRAMVEAWNRQYADEIAATAPDWPLRHAGEASLHGAQADAVGLDIARRWVSLLRATGKRAETA